MMLANATVCAENEKPELELNVLISCIMLFAEVMFCTGNT